MMSRIWRPRVLIYALLLIILSSAFIWNISHRSDHSVHISRDRGALARVIGNGDVENTYLLQVTNSLEHSREYQIKYSGPEGMLLATPANIAVEATGTNSIPVRLVLPYLWARDQGGKTLTVELAVQPVDQKESPQSVRSTFLVPK